MLTSADVAAGGRWTVGDRLPAGHPGQSEIVRYKSWVARPDKYGPGKYSLKDRATEGFHEFVVVMRGALVVVARRNSQLVRNLLPVGSDVHIGPEIPRAWELPADSPEARGVTVLWRGPVLLLDEGISGADAGFCLESWTHATADISLRRPFGTCDLAVQYVEVFNGELLCHAESTAVGIRRLRPGEFLYARPGAIVALEAKPRSYGAVLYYR